jgi:hypothetical protein
MQRRDLNCDLKLFVSYPVGSDLLIPVVLTSCLLNLLSYVQKCRMLMFAYEFILQRARFLNSSSSVYETEVA